jgi:putative membrane protein
MTGFHLRTLCAVLATAFAAAACNRQDNPPAPPKSMASSQGTTDPDVARTPPLPAGSPPATGSSAAPGSAPSQERGMGGVPGASAGSSAAPVAGSSAGPAAGPVAGSDRAFVSEAANSGLAEVEAARLVSARTDNAKVKDLAQHMEREHASTNDELKRIASEKGIELPSTIGGEPRGQLSRLTTLSKPEVDQAFVRDFGIEAHQKAISLFERQAREGQDPDLKAFAERTLPKLREHLAMAQRMQGGQGQAGPAGSAPR